MPRIPVEQKHTYNSQTFSLYGAITDASMVSSNIQIQFLTYPDLGVDENDRIGRKIRSDYITYETYYQMNTNFSNASSISRVYDNYIKSAAFAEKADDGTTAQNSPIIFPDGQTAFPEGGFPVGFVNSDQRPLDVTIREMFVEFDREFFEFDRLNAGTITYAQFTSNLRLKLHEWYEKLVIQTGSAGYPSNRNQIKRESTEYTGSFAIIKDKVLHLNFDKQIHHEFDTLKYIRSMNFDKKPDEPADDYFTAPTDKVLVRLWIGPYNHLVDYGNFGFGVYTRSKVTAATEDGILVSTVNSTMKLSYTDL